MPNNIYVATHKYGSQLNKLLYLIATKIHIIHGSYRSSENSKNTYNTLDYIYNNFGLRVPHHETNGFKATLNINKGQTAVAT